MRQIHSPPLRLPRSAATGCTSLTLALALAGCVSAGPAVPPAKPLARVAATAALAPPALATTEPGIAAGTPAEPGIVAGTPAEPGIAPGTGDWPVDGWWQAYGDPQLDALIAEGLTNAPDVATAAARFRKAQAMADNAGAALLPTLDGQGYAQETKITYNQGYPAQFVAFLPHGWHDNGQLALNFGFDPDLWGKNRAKLAAAISDRTAAGVDFAAARLALQSGIAGAYADFAEAVTLRNLRRDALATRQKTEALLGARFDHGLEERATVRIAAADTANARGDLANAERMVTLRRDEIAALVGAGPDRGLALAEPRLAPLGARALPADAATALIGRRADVIAARDRVEAAQGNVRAAHAEFFPSIKLEALVGYQALPISMLFDKSSFFGNAGPAVSLPIFHGGAIRANYRGAQADYDIAVGDYNAAVVKAYQQAADAVATRARLAEQLDNTRVALAASRDAYALASQRYAGGLANDLEVLTAEDRLIAAQVAVATLEAQARGADIDLVRALGGGFTPAAGKNGGGYTPAGSPDASPHAAPASPDAATKDHAQ